MVRRQRGVLWDMDGVLADTGDFHYHAWRRTLREFNIPFSAEAFRQTFGMNNQGILTILLGHEPDAEQLRLISEKKEARFRTAIKGHVRPAPGALDWLEELHSAGVRQAVASSAPQANVDALVEALGIGGFLQATFSGEGLPSKPDPAIFLRAAALIGIAPEDCLVVEDALAGVAAAREAGMRCVAVATTHPPASLQEADIVVQRLDELSWDDFKSLLPASVS
jgi:beta-phosphoglucomutase